MIWQAEKLEITQAYNREMLKTERKAETALNWVYGSLLINAVSMGLGSSFIPGMKGSFSIASSLLVHSLICFVLHGVISYKREQALESLRKTRDGVTELLGGSDNV